MKRVITYFVVVWAVFSCSQVIDKYPLDQITEETYWETDIDLELFINQLYPTFRNSGAFHSLEQASDNLQYSSPDQKLNGTRSIPASGGGWVWSQIRTVNLYLENSNNVSNGDAAFIKHLIGEGYFFRAYFYFALLRQFGDLPWIDHSLNLESEELYMKRESRDFIVDRILDDLDSAISMLQRKLVYGSNRINLEAALALKSRVSLYEGSWQKYHMGTDFGVEGSNGNKYFEIAVSSSKELMNMGTLNLYTSGDTEEDYWRLFNHTDLSNNEEAILVENVDPVLGLGNWNWRYFNGTSGRGIGITKSLVDSYLDVQGMPISLSGLYKGDTTLLQVVEKRDPRLRNTIWVPGQIQINGDPPLIFRHPVLDLTGVNDLTTTGYMIRKGSTTDPNQNTGSNTDNYGACDAFVFRYAEVLLNYAEAKAELGILTQGDLDISINIIRNRVGMPSLQLEVGFTDPNWDFPNLSPIINEIRRERRVELALEGFRDDDIMRWAAADELVVNKRFRGVRIIEGVSYPGIDEKIRTIPLDNNQYVDRYQNIIPDGFGFRVDRDYLSPLPINQLTLNPNLDQNPGW